MDKSKQQAREHKTLPFIVTKVDAEQGIVEHTVAVMGNVDLGGDRIHPGAFTKTIAERAGRIRVLDTHNADSVLDVIGKPLALWEVGLEMLPGIDFEIVWYPTTTLAAASRFMKGGRLEKTKNLHTSTERIGHEKTVEKRTQKQELPSWLDEY